ncbi:MAG: hypothetical protein ABJ327_06675 [Litoreibacter sp.]
MPTITFSEFSLGTVDPVYTFSDNRVVFDGVIVSDSAQPRTPTIAANTSYLGPVFFEFDNPVESVSLDVGFFNDIGSTRIEFLDSSGLVLNQGTNAVFGVDTFSFSSSAGISEVRVIDFAFDVAGFSVDTIVFGDIVTGPTAPPITLAALATSFEFNSGTLTEGTTSAFSNTLSNTDRTDSFRVEAPVAGTLTITSLLPGVSGSAETFTFDISAGEHIIGIGNASIDPGNVFYTVNWSFDADADAKDEFVREQADTLAFEVTSKGFEAEEKLFEIMKALAQQADNADDAVKILGTIGDAFGVAAAFVDLAGRADAIREADNFEKELFVQSYDLLWSINASLTGGVILGGVGLFFGGVGAPVGAAIGAFAGGIVYTLEFSEEVKEYACEKWDELIEPTVSFASLSFSPEIALASFEQPSVLEIETLEPGSHLIVLDLDFYLSEYPDAAALIESGEVASALAHYYAFGIDLGYRPNAETEPLQKSDIAINLEGYNPSGVVNTAVRQVALGELSGDGVVDLESAVANTLNSQRTNFTELNVNSELSAIANRIAKDWVLNNTEAYVSEAQSNLPNGWALNPPNGQIAPVPAGLSVLAAFTTNADVLGVLAGLTRGVEAANIAFGLDSKSLGVAEFGGLWVLVVSTDSLPDDVVVSNDPLLLKTIGTDGSDIVAAGNSLADVDLGDGGDSFTGGAFDDHVKGGGDDDQLDGGSGTDTAKYDGDRSNYLVEKQEDGSTLVTDLRPDSSDGTDTLIDFEFLEFNDEVIAVSSLSLNEIEGTSDRDNLMGTDDADAIRSLAGSYDRMTGGAGADEFIFGDETSNGRRERDVIMDYEVGIDSIVLEAGTSVASIRETSSQVVVFLDGDRDAIYVRGDGVTADNLTIISDDVFQFV